MFFCTILVAGTILPSMPNKILASNEISNNQVGRETPPEINWHDTWQTPNRPFGELPQTVESSLDGSGQYKVSIKYKEISESIFEAAGGDTRPTVRPVRAVLTFQNDINTVAQTKVENETTGVMNASPSITQLDSKKFIISLDDLGKISFGDTIVVTGKVTNINGGYQAPTTRPNSGFQSTRSETLLTRVYYMDESTGKTLPNTEFDSLGYGMTAGDNINASAKNFSKRNYNYTGRYSIVDPEKQTNGSGESASTILRIGDDLELKELYDPTSTTGKQAIVFWYQKEITTGQVTARYVDTDGKQISDDVIQEGSLGDNWTTHEKSILGYTLKKVEGSNTGTYAEKNQVVTYVYAKNPVTPVDPTNPGLPVTNGTSIGTGLTQAINNQETKKSLPNTGMDATANLSVLGALIAASGAVGYFFFGRKKKK